MARVYSSEIWEAIREEYRTGALSIRSIAAQHKDGPSEAAIRKRAHSHGWTRDLSDQVRAETQAKLQRSAARPKAKDSEVVEAAAARNFEALQKHMKSLGRLAEIEDRLADRLEKAFLDIDALDGDEALVSLAEDIAEKAISRSGKSVSVLMEPPAMIRAKLFKIASGCADSITSTTAKRIQLERQALSLDKPDEAKVASGFVFECDLGGRANG